jgi:inhibitor of KinA sporulation pathway (predicted exonuclease)
MSKYKLVVDLEATCCANNEFPRHEMEIIEIGAVLLDSENKTVSTFQTFVKPTVHPLLTDFCKELTTITQDQVDTAPSFNIAMTSFLNWVHEYVIVFYDFYSWGDFDKNIISRQAKQLNYKNPKLDVLLSNHFNLKQIFADRNGVKPMGVSSALKFKGLKFENQQHRAIYDAINIAKLIDCTN